MGMWYTFLEETEDRSLRGIIMKKRIENWVKKLDSLVGWTLLFYVIITCIILYSIFTDFTNATDFIYNAF
ncbi:hypothetical protein HMPREF3106_04600 [Granulicatella sp. HMSC31F03]|nr:hypothetical protein [Granulicatella sp.]OFT01109.1 hypothetical protein HMPREF3106_04600 [Granulicatella sp. HMSC31F03]